MSMALFAGRTIDIAGNARASKLVTIRLKSSGAIATIYSDNDGTTLKDNPTTTGADGSFSFYANDDDYTVTDDLGFALSDVTLFSGAARSQVSRKSIDEIVNNSNVLQDDDDLKSTTDLILPGETWDIKMLLLMESKGGSGFKWTFTLPAGASYSYKHAQLWDGTSLESDWAGALTDTETNNGFAGTPPETIWLNGTLVNGATAGTIQFQWCQNLPAGNDTTVFAGSYMILRRVG